MVADCLSKAMRDNALVSIINTNHWDSEYSEEARLIKHKNSFTAASMSRPWTGSQTTMWIEH